MRKLLFLMLAAAFTQAAQAQLFLGGSFNFSTSSEETTSDGTTSEGPTTTNFGIQPKAGFFLNDQFAIGGGIGFSTRKVTTPGDPETESTSNMFNINPFARYYLIQSGDFSLFGEGGVDLGFGSSETSSDGTTNEGPSTTTVEVYVAPRIAYAIGGNVVLEAGIGGISFESWSQETEGGGITTTDKETDFGLNIGLNSFVFGMIVML